MTADKVWIVDDDRSIRWVLEKALMQEGLEATTFEDAQTLLKNSYGTSRFTRDCHDGAFGLRLGSIVLSRWRV